DWHARPDAALGRAAVVAAAGSEVGSPVAQGSVGARTGAVTGTGSAVGAVRGGVGTASGVLPSGVTVAALAAVNAAGSPLDPHTGELCGEPGSRPAAAAHAEALRRLAAARQETARRARTAPRPPLN